MSLSKLLSCALFLSFSLGLVNFSYARAGTAAGVDAYGVNPADVKDNDQKADQKKNDQAADQKQNEQANDQKQNDE